MAQLADIFRRYGPEYLKKHQDHLLPSHKRAMVDIQNCRTEFFGGQLYECNGCGKRHYTYHSCKNRHCPKCQNDSTENWIEQQQSLLLPVKYFLVTYTLPEELRSVARSNQKTVYGSLFRTSAAALQKLALDPRYVGAKIGMTGVLQTWTRDLMYHPHVHYIVPGGGLHPDGQSWQGANYSDFLVHEKPLAIIFKEKFRQEMIKADIITTINPRVWNKDWVVDCKPVGTGQQALKYLAPYVYRVAITNNRILNIDDAKVRFLYKNSDTGKWKPKTIPAEEFIRRFLQHILPKGFIKVRYYGLLHSKNRQQLQSLQTKLQPQRCSDNGNKSCQQKIEESENKKPKEPMRCQKCGGELICIEIIRPKARSSLSRAPP